MLAWLVVTLVSAGCIGPRKVSDKDIESIDLPGLLALVDRQQREPDRNRLLLIDPRSELSFQRGHLPGAWNILLSYINPELGRDPQIEAYDHIVVYGDNPGTASAKAMVKRLLRIRYKGVRWFPGGLEEWQRAGLPVEGGG